MAELDKVMTLLRQFTLACVDDPLSRRRALVAARLTTLVERADDADHLGVSRERICAMLRKTRCLAFGTEALQSEFFDRLRMILRRAELVGTIRIIGTSTTLFSLNPEKSVEHYFDASTQPSDLDLGLECANMSLVAARVGIKPNKSKINPAGSFSREQLGRLAPDADELLVEWEGALGRTIQIGAPADGRPTPFSWITDYRMQLEQPGS